MSYEVPQSFADTANIALVITRFPVVFLTSAALQPLIVETPAEYQIPQSFGHDME